MMTCDVKQMAAQPIVSVRTCVPGDALPQYLGQAFSKLEEYLAFAGEPPSGPPFVMYYNMDMQNLDVEVGFPTARLLDGGGDVKSGQMPSGNYASCLYTGPYHEIAPAYQELNTWVGQHGYEPTGVAIEYYLNEPEKTPPQDLQTLIVFPLK